HLARVCDLLSVVGTLHGQKPDKERRTWLEHAKHMLSEEVNEEKSLEAIAHEVGMSYSTFRARFALEAGQSPARFRAQCRVIAAQKLLERPELSVKAISRSLGWSDEFAFAKNFKAFTGQTPRTYRLGLKG
ncbi:MAG: AraC family transcriptional regulator, partial [Cytophagaceae bacterium]